MNRNDKIPLHIFSSIGICVKMLAIYYNIISNFIELFTEEQAKVEALPGETVTLVTELSEPGLEVTWLKDNVPLSVTEGKYQTVNNDCSYEITIPDVKLEDGGEYRVEGGGYESTVSLTLKGRFSTRIDSQNESNSEKKKFRSADQLAFQIAVLFQNLLQICEIEITCFMINAEPCCSLCCTFCLCVRRPVNE